MLLDKVNDPLPSGDNYNIEDRADRGRGCFAERPLVANTLVLTAQTPLVHVIFRKYKKEVCAWCFNYDRGKIWSTSFGSAHPSSPKQEVKIAWFCSDNCLITWRDYHDDLTYQSLVALELFSREYSPETKGESITAELPKPSSISLEEVDLEWNSAELIAEELRHARLSEKQGRRPYKSLQKFRISLKTNSEVDLDVVAFFVRGIIARYKSNESWQTLYTLAPSKIAAYQADPYGLQVLKSHCLAYMALQIILPKELLQFCERNSLRALVERDCTNAFGLNSDSGDEYFGYGVWVEGSFFNHSCYPNIRKSTRERSWLFETERMIEPGEELCISYLGSRDELKMSLAERREKLLRHWGFLCLCSRCVKELELEAEDTHTTPKRAGWRLASNTP